MHGRCFAIVRLERENTIYRLRTHAIGIVQQPSRVGLAAANSHDAKVRFLAELILHNGDIVLDNRYSVQAAPRCRRRRSMRMRECDERAVLWALAREIQWRSAMPGLCTRKLQDLADGFWYAVADRHIQHTPPSPLPRLLFMICISTGVQKQLHHACVGVRHCVPQGSCSV